MCLPPEMEIPQQTVREVWWVEVFTTYSVVSIMKLVITHNRSLFSSHTKSTPGEAGHS